MMMKRILTMLALLVLALSWSLAASIAADQPPIPEALMPVNTAGETAPKETVDPSTANNNAANTDMPPPAGDKNPAAFDTSPTTGDDSNMPTDTLPAAGGDSNMPADTLPTAGDDSNMPADTLPATGDDQTMPSTGGQVDDTTAPTGNDTNKNVDESGEPTDPDLPCTVGVDCPEFPSPVCDQRIDVDAPDKIRTGASAPLYWDVPRHLANQRFSFEVTLWQRGRRPSQDKRLVTFGVITTSKAYTSDGQHYRAIIVLPQRPFNPDRSYYIQIIARSLSSSFPQSACGTENVRVVN